MLFEQAAFIKKPARKILRPVPSSRGPRRTPSRDSASRVALLAEVRAEVGMPIITEVMTRATWKWWPK